MESIKFLSMAIAGVLACYSSWAQTAIATVEAESGIRTGVVVANQTSNSSGKYVTGFDAAGDKLTVTVNVPSSAIYKLEIKYRANQGTKTQDLYINNAPLGNVTFNQSVDFVAINVGNVALNSGNNTIAIVNNWGYMDLDKFTVYTSQANVYSISPNLVDPLASPATKDLYNFLRCQFGKTIISGQTFDFFDNAKSIIGKTPMLKDYDFQHYTQGYAYKWGNGGFTLGAVDDKFTEAAIEWYTSTQNKGIVSFQWHWHSPTGGSPGTNTFMSGLTTFDVSKAVQIGTPEYSDIIEDIDAIAVQLKKLQAANVPVIFRPLHEAGGTWFWWGSKGSAVCKALYDILYDRITNYHGIHNLIWTWSSVEPDWYPGNSKVDIIGYDSYPGEFNYTVQKTMFDQLYTIVNGEKLIAMTENGPIPDIDKCFTTDAPWSYFMLWGNSISFSNSAEHYDSVFANSKVLTIENSGSCVVTALNDKQAKESASILYPNPFREAAQIQISKPFEYEIIDLAGNRWEKGKGKGTLEVGRTIPSGVYLIVIKTSSEEKRIRIVKY
jgi:mannan endo-1,4-beta-mannosidase